MDELPLATTRIVLSASGFVQIVVNSVISLCLEEKRTLQGIYLRYFHETSTTVLTIHFTVKRAKSYLSITIITKFSILTMAFVLRAMHTAGSMRHLKNEIKDGQIS